MIARIDYTLTEGDLIEAFLHESQQWYRLKSLAIVILAATAFSILGRVAATRAPLFPTGIHYGLYALLAVLCLYDLIGLALEPRRYRKKIQAGGYERFFLPQSITLSPDCFFTEYEMVRAECSYSTITRIDASKNLLLLKIGPSSAVAIPVRSFEGRQQLEEFVETIKEKSSCTIHQTNYNRMLGKKDVIQW